MARKLKLISDGSPEGTKVIDVKSGEHIGRVQAIHWSINATEKAKLTVVVEIDDVEIEGEAEIEVNDG